MSSPLLRLATRKSALALWQTRHVARLLAQVYPDLKIELVPLSTRGDEILDRSLAAVGGKGLFLKELEVAMLEDRADAAVHSLKDVPMQIDPPFVLAAILPRDDPFDALISNHVQKLEELPNGARVGTSSLRRQAQLRALRPDLKLLDLRGNVNTRLGKLDIGDYDAVILAAAGLHRLDLAHRITEKLLPPQVIPAVAQGAIAIECRKDDSVIQKLLGVLDDQSTRICVTAERVMNQALHGSCHVPIAGFATIVDEKLYLQARVGRVDDGYCIDASLNGAVDAPIALGKSVAAVLKDNGADQLLDSIQQNND